MTIENWKEDFERAWENGDLQPFQVAKLQVKAFIESLLQAKDEEIKGLKQQLDNNASGREN